MNFIEWDEAIHSLGLRKIDDQHKQLVGLINALHKAQETGKKELLEKVLSTLQEYIDSHFRDEEKLMKKIHYPAYNQHHHQHLKFHDMMVQAHKDLNTHEGAPEIAKKLTAFLKNWLLQHIMVEDRAYADFLFG